MKKIVSLLLCLALVAVLLPPQAGFASEQPQEVGISAPLTQQMPSEEAAEGAPSGYRPSDTVSRARRDDPVGSIDWSFEDGVLTVTGTGVIADYSTTQLPPWRDERYDATSIVIGEGITAVGAQAFAEFYKVTSVTLPSTLRRIGSGAFYRLSSLARVTLPDGLERIESGAFCYAGLTELRLPDSLTVLEEFAFQNTKLVHVDFPRQLVFDVNIFLYCPALTGIDFPQGHNDCISSDGIVFSAAGKTLLLYPAGRSDEAYTVPESVSAVGPYAFTYAQALRSVCFPAQLREIGEYAFYRAQITEAALPEGLETMGDGAFRESRLQALVLPDGLTYVPYWGFSYCNELTSVTLGSGIRYIYMSAFRSCRKLKTVSFSDSGALRVIWGAAFMECTSLERIALPEGLRYLLASVFDSCGALSSVQLPSTLELIGGYAFYECARLSALTLPENLTEIGVKAFSGTSALAQINYPDSLRKVSRSAFEASAAPALPSDFTLDFGGDYYRCPQLSLRGTQSYGEANEVLRLVNEARAEAGVTPLSYDEQLSKFAMLRAAEIAVLFSHDRPTGVGVLSSVDFAYGENIAMGPSAASGAMNLWMNSAGHRANILTSGYTEIGIGCFRAENGATYWVQVFGIEEPGGTPRTGEVTLTQNVLFYPEASYQDTSLNGKGEDYFAGDTLFTPYYTLNMEPELKLAEKADKRLFGIVKSCDGTNVSVLNDQILRYEIADPAVLQARFEQGALTLTGRSAGQTDLTVRFGSSEAICHVTVASQGETHEHRYWAIIHNATCTDAGYIDYTCSVEGCGSHYTEILPPLGHNFVNGVCTRCGATDGQSDKPCDGGATCPSKPYKDVNTRAWYHESIDFAIRGKLMNGIASDRFDPEGSMTRAMLVTVLWRYAGSPKEGTNRFTDVASGQWYTEAVAWAAANGVVNGVGNNRFDPEGKITREQMAAILYRYAKQPQTSGSLSSFPDASRVSGYATDAMRWTVEQKIIGGSDGRLDPQGNATRAQVAAILMRFIKNVAQ